MNISEPVGVVWSKRFTDWIWRGMVALPVSFAEEGGWHVRTQEARQGRAWGRREERRWNLFIKFYPQSLFSDGKRLPWTSSWINAAKHKVYLAFILEFNSAADTVPQTPPLPPRDEQTRGRRKSIEILVVVQDEVVRKDSSIIIVLPSFLLQLGYHFNSSTYRGGIRIGGAKDLYLFCISSNHPPTHSPLAQIEYSLSICTRAKSLIDVCSCISPSLFSHWLMGLEWNGTYRNEQPASQHWRSVF